MRFDAIEREIRSIVAAKAARDPEQIGPYEDFEEDLGLDSLDRLDVLAEVEDELGIWISEDETAAVRTLDGLLKVVSVRPRKRAA